MRINGIPASSGIAIAKVLHYIPFTAEAILTPAMSINVEEELLAFSNGVNKCKNELETIIRKLQASNDQKYKIFQAHIDIAEDDVMCEEVKALIQEAAFPAFRAVETVYNQYIEVLEKSKDSLIRERAVDLRDVKLRLERILLGAAESDISALNERVIVVAHDLLPSDTATLDKAHVVGIITEIGGTTSHTAIIAREFGIPAIVGATNALQELLSGEIIGMDASEGIIETSLDAERTEYYEKAFADFLAKREDAEKYLYRHAATADGVAVEIGVNLGGQNDDLGVFAEFTDFVGLYRTEFLYMTASTLPDEQTQLRAYQRVLTAYRGRPVILRTLDVGGDKTLPCIPLPKESNPFLGNRALRLCFSMPELFKTQLRAALRASGFGDLWIMLPMVGSLDDIRKAKEIIECVKAELSAENIPYHPNVKVGIMIEVPSVAILADFVAKEVDFASIGTNDLCQYTLAADRINPTVTDYYQSYHPAVFRLIRNAVNEFVNQGKPISVCGELGGDPLVAPVLVGLGLRKLSMSASAVAKIKRVLSSYTIVQMEELAKKVLLSKTAQEAKKYMLEFQKEV